MPDFTVLIPTHNHEDTLRYSVASVQWQTRQDFELFIVGDGVGDRTREVVAELIAHDDRIRFFDNPKGQRNGERARHEALQQASGRFVCYQSDEDLWMPEHLETMAGLLEHHDLAHTMQIEVAPDGSVLTAVFDAAADPLAIRKMERREAGFGLCTGGHRLDAYRKLSDGWMPAPSHMASDLHFWLQFLYQPWCRYVSHKWPEVLHLSSDTRRALDTRERVDEIARCWSNVQTPQQRAAIVRRSMTPLLEQFARSRPANDPALTNAINGLKQQLSDPQKDLPPALHPYAMGEVIRFGTTAATLRYIHVGLLDPEPWGCWTGSTPAQIVLPLAAPMERRVVLHLEAIALLHPPARAVSAFEIKVNGQTVLHVHEGRSHADYAVDIPAALCANLRVMVLEFVPLMPASPQELGLNTDARALGIGLMSLSIDDGSGPA
ncbi:hypothetical protein QFZ42_003508 [Variovorax paradoxus]|uniref:glycosyltransferase family 2 protein n=1 Tax=Variovorax paradoxus TaxID=34073 RepID=UPI00278DEB0A|nr:glycosyltransferase family A protein [Variovorax paradoxus]MDQ0571674.1 hypothetical protein [Variovorax paradoxus]